MRRKSKSHMDKKPNGQSRLLNVILCFALLGFTGLFVFSGFKLAEIKKVYQTGTDTYADIAESAVTVVEAPPAEMPVITPVPNDEVQSVSADTEISPAKDSEPTADEKSKPTVTIRVDFEKLMAINPDTEAWISNGAEINYPVVHAKDNNYYLKHLFDGTENENGAIFTDARNSPGFIDRNTFVYGHNMQNGAMFANLMQYGNPGYYEEHPVLELVTPDGAYVLEAFSGYVTLEDSDTFQLRFSGDESYEDYLEKIQSQSDFESDVKMTVEDRMVTLSTCTLESDERYVLHCKLVKCE